MLTTLFLNVFSIPLVISALSLACYGQTAWLGVVGRRQSSMPICYKKVTDFRDFFQFNELTKISRGKLNAS